MKIVELLKYEKKKRNKRRLLDSDFLDVIFLKGSLVYTCSMGVFG